ncbi:PLD nuclease N-terminal domain-containing protein [Sutcliffiella horikoshii]|uniref:PLD nuclease N-terminal domain-containing protein n=1 Tax=Sutcliffiella horikoshii TaxID=79883 RepID=UPI001F1F92DF|nr:PLD nuclease N-terminal domain-containing protein [Sutcliffiella horikoshii]MCG1023686.1 PLDc_N domain-containing protein [Sutcliffiella horikoshii]
MENINWSLAAPLIVLQLILVVTALISLARQEHTNGPKWVWAFIILFITTIGPILYFIIGRKND